jgi:membrane dipeptidase
MRNILTVDGHCDTAYKAKKLNIPIYRTDAKTHLDIEILMGEIPHIQLFALYSDTVSVDEHYRETVDLMDYLYRYLDPVKNDIVIIDNKEKVKECICSNKLGIIISLEGAYLLANNPHRLEMLYKLGVRCISLTWNHGNELCGGIGDKEDRGLSEQGREIIRKMNNLGIVVDLSHISKRGFWDIIDMTEKPVIASHSNCTSICPHRRNLDDDQIKAIGRLNGVIGINFVPDFLGEGKNSISGIVDHIEFVIEKAGPNCVGLGSDFDGTEKLPDDIDGYKAFYKIKNELSKRNYDNIQIGKILGGNFQRVFKEVL